MKILSVECSASPASVAVIDDGKIIASSFMNVKLTHSQTLLPMIESTLKSAMLTISDIDGFAVAAGPGSFTGIRIGISAVKGLAAADNLPCCAVSTLEAMAYMFLDQNAVICPVMDARCNQLYNALFRIENGKITRLCDDRAILIEQLKDEICSMNDCRIIICGDGSDIFYEHVKNNENAILAAANSKFQNAVGVALMSYTRFINNDTVKSNELLPFYLRLPQAERELKLKNEKKDEKL